MPSFSDLKDMYRLQKEAKKVRKELANIHVEAEGRYVHVTVTGEQNVHALRIVNPAPSDEELCADIIDCTNRAMKKSQVVAAERMQGVMGGMGLPTGM